MKILFFVFIHTLFHFPSFYKNLLKNCLVWKKRFLPSIHQQLNQLVEEIEVNKRWYPVQNHYLCCIQDKQTNCVQRLLADLTAEKKIVHTILQWSAPRMHEYEVSGIVNCEWQTVSFVWVERSAKEYSLALTSVRLSVLRIDTKEKRLPGRTGIVLLVCIHANTIQVYSLSVAYEFHFHSQINYTYFKPRKK